MDTKIPIVITTNFFYLLMDKFNDAVSKEIDIPLSFIKKIIAFSENSPDELISLNIKSLETVKDFCSMISEPSLVERIEQIFIKTSLVASFKIEQEFHKECISKAIQAIGREFTATFTDDDIVTQIKEAQARFELSINTSSEIGFSLNEFQLRDYFKKLVRHWSLNYKDIEQLPFIQESAYILESFNLMIGRPLKHGIVNFAEIGIYRIQSEIDTMRNPSISKEGADETLLSPIRAIRGSIDYLNSATREDTGKSLYREKFRFLFDTLSLFSLNRSDSRVVVATEETDHFEAYIFINFHRIFKTFTEVLDQNPIPPEDIFILFNNLLKKLNDYSQTSKLHKINFSLICSLSTFALSLIKTLIRRSDAHLEVDQLESTYILLNKLKSYTSPTSEEEVTSCEADLAEIRARIQSTSRK